MIIDIKKVRKELEARNDRSAWNKGVTLYALEMLDDVEERMKDGKIELGLENLREVVLNGANDWKEYSYGACSLIYNEDIAKRLCTPSELKRKDNGRLPPKRGELWLDVQTRALGHAYHRLKSIMRKEAGL